MLIQDLPLVEQLPGIDPELFLYVDSFIKSNTFPLEILNFLLNFESINGVDMSGEYIDESDVESSEPRETDIEIKTRVFFETIVCMYSKELKSRSFRERALPEIITELAATPEIRVYFYQMLIKKGRSQVAEA